MSYLFKASHINSEYDQDDDEEEIDNLLSIDRRQQQQESNSLFLSQQQNDSIRENDLLNSLLSKLSQPSQQMTLLQSTLSRHLSDLPPSRSKHIFQNLQKKCSLLIGSKDSNEAGMSRSNSSLSNISKQYQLRRQKSESSEDQQQEEYDYEIEDEIEDEESILEDEEEEEEEENPSNSISPIKQQKAQKKQGHLKLYENDLIIDGKSNSTSDISLISNELLEGYMKLEPIEKIAIFKKHKQSFLRQTSLAQRRFFCEIIYDKIEEEKIIKTKHISRVVGFILNSCDPFSHKFLIKLIEEKDLRIKKVKEVLRAISDEDNYDRISIPPYHSVYRIQKFKDDLKSLLQEKNDEKSIELEDTILKDLHERRQEIANYQENEDFKRLIEQIIIQKTKRFYNFSKSSQLIASFLMNSDISINYIIKYLIDPERLQNMCNSAVDIIRVLSESHKEELAK